MGVLDDIAKKELKFKKNTYKFYARKITIEIEPYNHIVFGIENEDKKVVNDISNKIAKALKNYSLTKSYLFETTSKNIEK